MQGGYQPGFVMQGLQSDDAVVVFCNAGVLWVESGEPTFMKIYPGGGIYGLQNGSSLSFLVLLSDGLSRHLPMCQRGAGGYFGYAMCGGS